MCNMLNENDFTFKMLEQNIFELICQWGQELTRDFLEAYDKYLMKGRDKAKYRNKGLKRTTIKTVYGEVVYQRRTYETTREDGLKEYVFLLDETLRIADVGLISQNLAEQIVSGITELSYRNCAKEISKSGQSISAMGVWNVIQALGNKVCESELDLVLAHKEGKVKGKKETKVLFEEIDGVYINLQREKTKSKEMKVGIAYDGWKQTGKDRYSLTNKVAVAGFSSSNEFKKYREANIAKEYDIDEVEYRIVNGDGADWIKDVCKENDAIFQLDPYHRNKAIKMYISEKKVRKAIYEYLDNLDIDGLFEYLEMYRDSITEDDDIEKVSKLIEYFSNNKNSLISYKEQELQMDAPPEGIEYRNMGTMENHIWSIIARRMKHNHTSWSIRGGNNMAKILAKKCSGRLDEIVDKLYIPTFEKDAGNKIINDVLSAAQVPTKVGKGYRYPVSSHLIKLEAASGISRKMWLAISGYGAYSI